MTASLHSPTPFSTQLRYWRRSRALTQLELAHRADTTPRHLSFLESGRSRPGRDMILRLAESLDLPLRDRNDLLKAAGLPAAYAERSLDDTTMESFVAPIRAILDNHSPYPASAYDPTGKIHFANDTFKKLVRNAVERTAEEAIDIFYGEEGQALYENWAEIAWASADRRRREALQSSDPTLQRLADRALSYLEGVPRPAIEPSADDPPVVCSRLRVGDLRLSTFSTLLRFWSAREVTLSELRIELVFPADEVTKEFFHQVAAAASVADVV